MQDKAMNSDYRHIHFVGIGGIGMSGIARVLAGLGYKVSGSDLRETPLTRSLQDQGIAFYKGHASQNVVGADVVVVSSAVPKENPEVQEARQRQIPVLQRAEMLGYLMERRYGIAVAGTHGKTTTTSMLAYILEKAGKDPTVVIGGELNDFGSNAKLGKSNLLVAEADESDASFLTLYPQIAVVTNIDADVNPVSNAFASFGFDYEKTLNHVKEVFLEFLRHISPHGKAILGYDCPHVRKLVPQLTCNILTFGFHENADLQAQNVFLAHLQSCFDVYHNGQWLGKIELRVPGRHNVLNALGAIGACLHLGIPFSAIAEALQNFHGVKRRFQIVGEAGGVLIVDDYGHNPAKIAATLKAAKEGWPDRRIVAVFQPHRYTRTKFLKHEFLHAFKDADCLLVTEIYSAGEEPILGVSGKGLAEEIQKANPAKKVFFCPTEESLLESLLEFVSPKDMVITLGAGDIHHVGTRLYEALKQRG
jgi:UDP-N-acetylmuramate--alanine ligase